MSIVDLSLIHASGQGYCQITINQNLQFYRDIRTKQPNPVAVFLIVVRSLEPAMTSFSKFSKSLAVAIRRLKQLYWSQSFYIPIVLLLYHDHRILSSTILSYYLTDVSLHCANCTKHLLTSELKKTKRSKFRQWKRSRREAREGTAEYAILFSFSL